MNCPQCGKEVVDTAKFCKFCGSQIATQPTSVPVQVTSTSGQASQNVPVQTVTTPAQPSQATEQNGGQQVNVTIAGNQPVIQKNGLGTAGFVLALIGIFLGWIPVLGWLVWFLGAVFSVIGIFRKPKGLAIAGTVLSFIDLIILMTIFGGLATLGIATRI